MITNSSDEAATRRFVVALIATLCVGLIVANTLPNVMGGLSARTTLSETVIGNLSSVEFGATAIFALILAARIERFSLARLTITGCLVAATAQFASAYLLPDSTSRLMIFFVLRIVVGAGEGLVLSAGNAALARSDAPTRYYALAALISAGVSAGFLALVPHFQAAWFGAAYVGLGALTLIPLAFAGHLQPDERRATGEVEDNRPRDTLTSVTALAGVLLFNIALSALWAFSELMGTNAGLTRESAGVVLGVNLAAGLIGSLIAAIFNVRWGNVLPLIVGILALGACAYILGAFDDVIVYALGQTVYGFFYSFTIAYLMAAIALLDRSGRLVTAAGGLTLIGFAIGPGAGGLAMHRGGFATLGSGTAAGLAVSALAIYVSTKRLHRGVPS